MYNKNLKKSIYNLNPIDKYELKLELSRKMLDQVMGLVGEIKEDVVKKLGKNPKK